MMRRKSRGQSTLEYTVIIAVVVGALIAMNVYMKRGLQGKLRESTDQVGEQFEAENTSSFRNVSRTSKTVQNVTSDGATVSSTGGTGGGTQESRTEYGNETVDAW